MKNIVVLCGESASGKTFIQNILSKQLGFHTMVSVCTRPRRSQEIEGFDYYFIKDSVFDKLIEDDDLLESRTYNTIQDGKDCIWRYALEKSEVLDDVVNVVVTDLQGMKELKNHFGEDLISILIKVPLEDRRLRAIARDKNYDKDEFERRAIDDAEKFKNAESEVDYYVYNVDLFECVNNIKVFLTEKGII